MPPATDVPIRTSASMPALVASRPPPPAAPAPRPPRPPAALPPPPPKRPRSPAPFFLPSSTLLTSALMSGIWIFGSIKTPPVRLCEIRLTPVLGLEPFKLLLFFQLANLRSLIFLPLNGLHDRLRNDPAHRPPDDSAES